jgi:S-DNA-T family DNA segregation ATPase FtsK/SpoIIIE
MSRRSRARRFVRRRHDAIPLLYVPDDRYPGQTLEALARWTFRYRSELAPLAIAATLGITAIYLHARRPSLWPAIAALTTALAVFLWRFSGRWLDRPAERSYAASVAALAGTWLTTAVAIGPGIRPLPTVWFLGMLAAGLPWWTHRRRRARVRVERTLESWPRIADETGLPGSRVLSAVVDRWGWRALIHLRGGQTATDALNRLPAIESALGTRRGAGRIEPDPSRADRAYLRILERDPHAKPIRWPGPTTSTITEPVELGLFEDATPVRLSLLRKHTLIGGTTGSGKSGLLNVLLAALTGCPDVLIWGVDLKNGMELQPWARCLDRLATTPAQADALVADAVRILEARAEQLAAEGERIWEPTPERPALIVVIDEYGELAETARDALTAADSIARRGRAPAVTLVVATQRPTQQVMGSGAVRSQMEVRICLRVRERRDVDLVLGQGMLAAGWNAHTLDAPGKFFVSAPGVDTPRRARGYLLDGDELTAAITRNAATRPASLALSPRPEPDAAAPEPTHDPEVTLWTALLHAGPDGMSIPALVDTTGKSRSWVYGRLQQHAAAGRAAQVSRGRWTAANTS